MIIGISSAGSKRLRNNGFTLLELLIVLALLGLMLALVPPAFSGRVQALSTRGSVLDLAAGLREARGLAIRDGRVARLQLSSTPASFRLLPDGRERELTSGMQIEFRRQPDQRWARPAETPVVFQFYPDGSASGGEVRLREGRQRFVLRVDWLLGRVEVQRGDDSGA